MKNGESARNETDTRTSSRADPKWWSLRCTGRLTTHSGARGAVAAAGVDQPSQEPRAKGRRQSVERARRSDRRRDQKPVQLGAPLPHAALLSPCSARFRNGQLNFSAGSSHSSPEERAPTRRIPGTGGRRGASGRDERRPAFPRQAMVSFHSFHCGFFFFFLRGR